MPPPGPAAELERLAGKVVFGSDCRALPLAPETITAILGGNAARILGWGETPAQGG